VNIATQMRGEALRFIFEARSRFSSA